jgi:hypothetical protein
MILIQTNPSFQIISRHGIADVVENIETEQKSLHSAMYFNAGDVLCSFGAGIKLNQPTYLTVQVSEDGHITLNPEFLQYINHSCSPNAFFDTTSFQLIALKDLNVGDEITFFYPSTEWDMVQPFTCFCNSKNCLHTIQGASHLSNETLQHYRLTDFIQQQLHKRNSSNIQ